MQFPQDAAPFAAGAMSLLSEEIRVVDYKQHGPVALVKLGQWIGIGGITQAEIYVDHAEANTASEGVACPVRVRPQPASIEDTEQAKREHVGLVPQSVNYLVGMRRGRLCPRPRISARWSVVKVLHLLFQRFEIRAKSLLARVELIFQIIGKEFEQGRKVVEKQREPARRSIKLTEPFSINVS